MTGEGGNVFYIMNAPNVGEHFTKESYRILVVEDSPTQAEALKYILEQQHYRVSVAGDGREALEMIRSEDPKLVISDIVMPEMDGFMLCKKIKSDQSLKDLPIILLTALSDPEDVLKSLECGADSFITKPYDETYLLARIHHVLFNSEIRKISPDQKGSEIFFKGQKYIITSERKQILDLLLSTYEMAIVKNHELKVVQEKLELLNEHLEGKVEERTAALQEEIEEKRRAEEEVKRLNLELEHRVMERTAQLETILDNLTDGLVVSDLEGKLFHWNPAAVAMHGFSSLEECQLNLPEFTNIFQLSTLHGEILPLEQWPLARILRGETLRGLEICIRRLETPWQRIFNYGGTLARDKDGAPLLAVVAVSDITNRKLAEEELRQRTLELEQLTETLEHRVQKRTEELANANEALRHLSSKLLSAQEDERKRIASDLHDTIGASLAGIKFKVEKAIEQMEKAPNLSVEALFTIIPVVQESIEECRKIQMDLRPSMLDDLGLLATLSWFCRRFQTIYSAIRIEQEIDLREDQLPDALKIVIYRVIQEAMNNIAKHSKADFILLSFRKDKKRVVLTIQDNGEGFNLEKALALDSTRRGLGLSSMRERVELSGGHFSIESTKGKGTIVSASWPFH